MKKMDPRTLAADWSLIDPRRPPWSYISTAELAQVLRVHPQTLANWRGRSHLPPPVRHHRKRGHRNFYKISTIKTWLTGEPEEALAWEWLRKYMPEWPFETLGQAERTVGLLYAKLGFDRP